MCCGSCLAEQARGPGRELLVELLPKMAVAVAQAGLHRHPDLFDKGMSDYEYKSYTHYRPFVLDIAYILSALSSTAAEDSKSGMCIIPSHACATRRVWMNVSC